MKNKIFTSSLFIVSLLSFSQEKNSDSIKVTQLKDVVVTAQFEPQSLKKAVNNVRIITNAELKKLAANNLSDVLNQYLNITITPSSGTGRSTVSMFGLDGSYFKILVDNVPLVSDNTMGNDIDLTQINLDDIEQIELIEGSMGVTHGANAVSGILNIITKKSIANKWELSATVQEETVGSEYALFNQGKHIQSAKISHNINSNWFVSYGINRNDFAGYLDTQKGADYTEADGRRGYSWLPKLQYFSNGLISYKKEGFRAFYRFDYLNERIDFYNSSVITIANPPFGTNIFAHDKRYFTQRFYHHFNAVGKVIGLSYNVSISHQKQIRETENFRYNFQTNSEENHISMTNQSAEVLYSTGTLSNFFQHSKVDFQLGYELVNTNGTAVVDGKNQTFVPVAKRFENYDLFVASEIKASEHLLIRAGLRASIQNKFDNQSASSLGFRYLFENDIELRGSLGTSYRVPSFDELYSRIQFSGHNFFGNELLLPETSTSYDLNIKKTTFFESDLKLANHITAAYLEVDDRIDMAYIGLDPDTSTPIYQYININSYAMWNIATNHQIDYKNWKASLGFIYVGLSQVIDNGEAVSDDRFLYNFQFNSSVSYDVPRWNTTVSIFYKFNGKQQQFESAFEGTESIYKLSEIESYSFLDASLKKTFFKKRLDLTLGARNLLDVTRVNQGTTGGAHSTSSTILMGYGRSYFTKLTYNFNL